MSSDSIQGTPVSDDNGFLDADPAPNAGHKWETVFQDNGDIVEWQPGTVMIGFYCGAEMIELTEEQRLTSADPTRTHAPLLVFEQEDEDRWSTWETYQIKADRFQEDSLYRIECKRERKVKTGNMKSFKIQRDANGRSEH